MKTLQLSLPDLDATLALGRRLARHLPPRLMIHLEGDLGAGKTTLVRALLQAAGHRGPVRSPTYTLVEPYPIGDRQFYHLDLYRLSDPEELEYLGLRELLAEDAVVLVEWAQRGRPLLGEPDLRIRLAPRGEGREVMLEAASTAALPVVQAMGGC